jgi:hypothetical protein
VIGFATDDCQLADGIAEFVIRPARIVLVDISLLQWALNAALAKENDLAVGQQVDRAT